MSAVEKVIIMGAAGRDFHNFNVYFRDNPRYQVVAFTAAQIPDIDARVYPAGLAGSLYPEGVPIVPETELTTLIDRHQVDLVAFSYSDVPHVEVMHKASRAMAHGADFICIGATYTMLRSKRPVVSVCAVRTGCGKSQTTRHICSLLKKQDIHPVVVRHPMPYGDLEQQIVQRFARYSDFDKHNCTLEEREEYEPLVDMGVVVFAGVDYGRILALAEQEARIIVWDGGNNDTPFYRPDVHVVLFDPHRAGHELTYFPGETNLLMADVCVINKVDTALPGCVDQVRANIASHNPDADVVLAESPVTVSDPEAIRGKRVLVVEDGPTLTHGDMAFGAGRIAAETFGADVIVDPRPYARGSVRRVFEDYPHIRDVLPAAGYGPKQIRDLEASINAAEADVVVFATPIQLTRVLDLRLPALRVRYDYRDHGHPTLEEVLMPRLKTILREQGKRS